MNLHYSPVYKCPPEMVFHCRLIFYFTHLELLAMVLEVPSFLLAIYVTIKSPFHYNLTFIGIFMLFGYYAFLVGRFTTCLYEIGIFTFSEGHRKGENYPSSLITSSLLQFFYMGCACGISLAIAIERFFATYFVDTYEIKKRKWISLLVCSELIVVCTGCAFIILYGCFPVTIMVFIGVFISCTAFAFYLLLFMVNQRRLRKIQQERVDDKYTLSVRFQLSENLKVMTLLRNIVIFSGVNNVIMGVLLNLCWSNKFRSKHPIISLYLYFAFNCCVVVYSLVIIIIVLFSVRQYRVFFFSLRIVRFVLYPIVGRCFPNEFKNASAISVKSMTISAETDCYFISLSAQWNQKFDKDYP